MTAILFTLCLATPIQAASWAPIQSISLSEISLGEFPVTMAVTLRNAIKSSDGTRAAMPIRDNQGERVVVNGIAGPTFDRIVPNSIRMSVDGLRLIYVGQRGQTQYLWDEGKETELQGPLIGLAMTPNGKVLYTVLRSMPDRRARIFKDGTPVADADDVTGIQTSGETFAFFAKQTCELFVTREAGKEGPFDRIEHWAAGTSQNSYAFVGTYRGISEIVRPTVRLPIAADSMILALEVNATGDTVVHMSAVQNATTTDIVAYVNGKEVQRVSSDSGPGSLPVAFSKDGTRAAWAIVDLEHKQSLLNIDGKVSKVPDQVENIFLAPSADRVAMLLSKFDGTDALRWITLDNTAGPKIPMVRPESIKFSPDGTHFSYVAEYGDQSKRAVVDQMLRPGYSTVSTPTYGSTGDVVAYIVAAKNVWQLVTNVRKSVVQADDVYGETLQFSGTRELHFIGRRGKKLIRFAAQIGE